MPPNSHFSADLVKTEEIFNGKLHFSFFMFDVKKEGTI